MRDIGETSRCGRESIVIRGVVAEAFHIRIVVEGTRVASVLAVGVAGKNKVLLAASDQCDRILVMSAKRLHENSASTVFMLGREIPRLSLRLLSSEIFIRMIRH